MRTSEIIRKTAETDIMLTLNLDGTGKMRSKPAAVFWITC